MLWRASLLLLQLFVAVILGDGVALVAASGSHSKSHGRVHGSPIKKVISMLKMMQSKLAEEAEKKETMFNEFMCYCKTNTAALEKAIATYEDRIPQLQAGIEQSTAMHQQLQEDLKAHHKDRTEANKALALAAGLDAAARAEYSKALTSFQTNIKGLEAAYAALENGMSGFLQTRAADTVRKLSLTLEMSVGDRDMLSQYFSGESGQSQPRTAEIIGIIGQMKEEMNADLSKLTADEENRMANYNALVAAKKKEIGAASKAIEDKTARTGELAVLLTTYKNDLEDTREGLAQDKQFLLQLKAECKAKGEEWTVYQKNLAEETVALADTIKLLNDDDALELFKKTMPAASSSSLQQQGQEASSMSFLQMPKGLTKQQRKAKAAAHLRNVRNGDPRMDFIQMALNGKRGAFDQVMANIDQLVADLKGDQIEDDQKRTYCNAEIDKTEDEIKVNKRDISDTETVIADAGDTLKEVNNNIQNLANSIRALDEQVKVSTETRKKESEQYNEALAQSTAAKSLLELAKNRLNKFYNPNLYAKDEFLQKRKRVMLDQMYIHAQNGEDNSVSSVRPGNGVFSFVQESSAFRLTVKQKTKAQRLLSWARRKVKKLRKKYPTELQLNYEKNLQSSDGVIAMLDLLMSDMTRQITELNAEEKLAQKDYEQFIKDSDVKRALDSKTLADKEANKAEIESKIHASKGKLKAQHESLAAVQKEETNLRLDCDWLLKNYDLRKEARSDEVDALGKAKAVLAGADFS